MRKILLILTLGFVHLGMAQNILFVDDNKVLASNSDDVITAVIAAGYASVDTFNVDAMERAPELEELSLYDLVVWYSSSDGVNLGFWLEGTSGLEDLKTYLENGGRLWVVGTDLLYGGLYATPTTFSAGDFAYDFMGLASYDAQSYGDDGGLGATFIQTTDEAPADFPDSLAWIFSTVWWIDQVTPRAEATGIYTMQGDEDYPLNDAVTMVFFSNSDTKTLSSFFDPAIISNNLDRTAFVKASIDYLLDFDLSTPFFEPVFSIAPNPSSDFFVIHSELSGEVLIFDLLGSAVKTVVLQNNTAQVSCSDLSAGMYMISFHGQSLRFIKK